MSSTVYDLTYSHHQKNGHYLLVSQKEGKELTENELIPLQIRMMQSNQIANMLRFSIEQMDFRTRLYYDITSKQTLDDFLKHHSLTSHEFYQLFLTIITTLEQSKLYMLNEEQYIVKASFIFIGKDPKELNLTYLPIHSIKKETSTLDELKELVLKIAKQVKGLQGSELNAIARYVENPSFSYVGLKDLLLELQRLRPNYNDGYSTFNQPLGEAEALQQAAQPDHASWGFEPLTPNKPINQAVSHEPPAIKGKNYKKESSPTTKKGVGLTQRQKVYVIAGSLLVLALIWKVFEIFPSSGMLYTCGVLSIAVIAGAAVFILRKPKADSLALQEAAAASEQGVSQSMSANGGKFSAGPIPPGFNYASSTGGVQNDFSSAQGDMEVQNILRQEDSMPVYSAGQADGEKESVHSQLGHHSDMMDTTLLSENDDTVLLGEDGEEIEETIAQRTPILEVERNGESETIVIHKNHFMIGRNEEAAHYKEDTVGVSRVHIELVKIDTTYGVKDLGSKNGTKLNDSPLVPYKIYALQENDVISIGKVEYRFKWE